MKATKLFSDASGLVGLCALVGTLTLCATAAFAQDVAEAPAALHPHE